MTEQDKALRGRKKATVTRNLKSLERAISEENENKIQENLERLMGVFDEFENAHYKYHDGLAEGDEANESEQYFNEMHDKYVVSMKEARTWLRRGEIKEEKAKEQPTMKQELPDIGTLMNLPKIELEVYDSNPLGYHAFKATFDEVVGSASCNNRAKLTRLLQFTKGVAKDAIRSCILLDDDNAYEKAWDILKQRFGNDHLVTERIVKNLRHGKPIRSPGGLQDLAIDLQSWERVLTRMGTLPEVESQSCILEILGRLESYLQLRWKRRAIKAKREEQHYLDFSEFVRFIADEAGEAADPVYGRITGKSNTAPKQPTKKSNLYASCVANVPPRREASKKSVSRCILCSGEHKLLFCADFKKMNVGEIMNFVVDNRLCFICLLGNHKTADCTKTYTCTEAGCGARHSKFLHVNQSSNNTNPMNVAGNCVQSSNLIMMNGNYQCQNTVKIADSGVSKGSGVHLPVVSVIVNGAIVVNALLDTGSSTSFCSSKLVDQLNLSTDMSRCKLSTLHGSNQKLTKVVRFKICSLDGSSSMMMSNVLVVNKIPVTTVPLDVSTQSHFADLSITAGYESVDVLIGQDCSEALIPLEVRKGEKDGMFAVRTLFGWAMNGPNRLIDSVSSKAISHFIAVSALEEKVDKLWKVEDIGVSENLSWSRNDHQVIDLWEKSVKKVSGHYQLPIPWKPGVDLQNNVSVARSRLKSLVCNLKRKDLYGKYDSEIKKMLVEGYAEIIPQSELALNRVWYLPHHCVLSESKPGKLRVVFDCAAKYEGESLNDKAYQGPDLCNKLLHVLLRFRQHELAIMADIKAMYYQVLIPPEDRDALRFLWFNQDGEICHFCMTRHVFGGVWCASSSIFALRKVVDDCPDIDPLVADTISRSFYVDDCLRSVPSVEEGQIVMEGTKAALKMAGFELTKFVVNNASLLAAIPPKDRASEVADIDCVKESKVLGVKWGTLEDKFYFEANVRTSLEVTRRSILSIVSSMYDPLGLVCPIVLEGRLIFQDATRLKISWDDPVSMHLKDRWENWIQGLDNISDLKFPRCIMHGDVSSTVLELHTFCDASMKAYGFCSYPRGIDRHGCVQTCLVLAKGKVAPLKVVTIPRLELMAAVMAAQASDLICNELDRNITKTYLWTDSEIVLKYIMNESKRFHVFVGNRLAQIHQVTRPDQWFHIPGKQNPADIVSRGASLASLDVNLWCYGPAFLREYKSDWDWPKGDFTLPDGDPEVKSTCSMAVGNDLEHPIDKLSKYYSSWFALKRSIAWLLRLKDTLRHRKRVSGHNLSVQEIKTAETVIIGYVQGKFYNTELDCLVADSPLPVASNIRSLDPKLDKEGIIRVGGRLRRADIAESQRSPVIIPFYHPIASLIVSQEHNKAHLGVEWVIANVRSKYWVTKVRRLARSISHKCVTCKRLFSAPLSQKMADHIPERLECDNPPFTHVGTDCFGPFLVKVGRAEAKRYGCIFTCLGTRAVHIEVLYSLDTDSFINGFRRFISRRGYPQKMWSDNGTNFVGASRELRDALKQLDKTKLHYFATKLDIEWVFNPPCSSHKGGLWERMIRTIRKVMAGLAVSYRFLTYQIIL